jgi:hypothetical protein
MRQVSYKRKDRGTRSRSFFLHLTAAACATWEHSFMPVPLLSRLRLSGETRERLWGVTRQTAGKRSLLRRA